VRLKGFEKVIKTGDRRNQKEKRHLDPSRELSPGVGFRGGAAGSGKYFIEPL
jgi:hypothetical protein